MTSTQIMYQNRLLLPTLREVPSDAEIASHQLMLRAGMIRKLAAGIYQMLPMGLRVQRNVEAIVRQSMNAAGAQEVQMPVVLPDELWGQSGRLDQYGPELARWKDRHGRGFVLGPTHEEAVCDIARSTLKSYRDLPVNLYQIHTKFRDEVRPRFGVMRGREFVMKDAYSFHATESALDQTYLVMLQAYKEVFATAGLEFVVVDADSGNIGGTGSQEFMVLAESGEDAIATCSNCDYGANLEKAATRQPQKAETKSDLTLIHTPNISQIQAVADFLKVAASDCIKCMLYETDTTPLMVLLRGDRTVQDVKLQAAVNAQWVRPMEEELILQNFGDITGYLGPYQFPGSIQILADFSVLDVTQGVIGANQANFHFTGWSYADLGSHEIVDVVEVRDNDHCPACEKGTLAIVRGIEVGHIFKLGTKYSQAMGVSVLDEQGQSIPLIMGCYGIGITRTVAACIEQNHDENGITWPWNLAPWHIHMLLLDPEAPEASSLVQQVANYAMQATILVDDRQERPGVKFKDADLIGCPLQVVIGRKGLENGVIEYKLRKSGKKGTIALTNHESLATGLRDVLCMAQNDSSTIQDL